MNLSVIKEALSKATPGVHVVGKQSPNGLQNIGVRGVMTAQAFTEGDANLYANAPEWLSSLITTIESQKEEIEKERQYMQMKQNQVWALLAEIESLKAITELAVKSLKEIKDRCKTAGAYTNDAYIHLIAHKALGEIKRLNHEN